jgi:hypothetical protein
MRARARPVNSGATRSQIPCGVDHDPSIHQRGGHDPTGDGAHRHQVLGPSTRPLDYSFVSAFRYSLGVFTKRSRHSREQKRYVLPWYWNSASSFPGINSIPHTGSRSMRSSRALCANQLSLTDANTVQHGSMVRLQLCRHESAIELSRPRRQAPVGWGTPPRYVRKRRVSTEETAIAEIGQRGARIITARGHSTHNAT